MANLPVNSHQHVLIQAHPKISSMKYTHTYMSKHTHTHTHSYIDMLVGTGEYINHISAEK